MANKMYKVASYEGHIVFETDCMAEAINKCEELNTEDDWYFILDKDNKDVQF